MKRIGTNAAIASVVLLLLGGLRAQMQWSVAGPSNANLVSGLCTYDSRLLSTLSPLAGSNAQDQDTYSSRNAYGVGYVRDDFLAEFAVRDPAIEPVAATVMLSAATVEAVVLVPVANPGSRYAVACCWPRRYKTDSSVADVEPVARSVGEFAVVIPFTTSFAYSGTNNLHVWITFGQPAQSNGVYEVDHVVDGLNASGQGDYGMAWATNGPGGLAFALGTCPVMALLAPVVVVPNERPELNCYGQPTIGRGLELQGTGMPGGLGTVLVLGDVVPYSSILGTCDGHIAPFPGQYWSATASPAGFVRWDTPPLPLDPALISHVVGYQAILGNNTLTNAVALTIGGAL